MIRWKTFLEVIELEKKKLAEIEWEDATHWAAWRSEKPEDLTFTRAKTVGYVIYEDKKKIMLAQTIAPERDHFSEVMIIPKSIIVKKRLIG